MASHRKILVVDDERVQRQIIGDILREAGYQPDMAENLGQGAQKVASGGYDLVLSDVRMPDGSGLDLLRTIKQTSPDSPVILMTAYGEVKDAVEAIKRGAEDYLQKPFNKEELLIVVEKALKNRRLRSERDQLQAIAEERYQLGELIGKSPEMQSLYRVLEKAMAVDSTVLIEGESGTGKDLAARCIHFGSQRKDRAFVVVNCAAIPETLVESELFGHVKGAFTGATRDKKGKFESADGGTIFLDEVGDMSPATQAKLLRVLQQRVIERVGGTGEIAIDVRVIAASNKDLEEMVLRQEFREDLLFRLDVIPLVIPPLRDRKGDIPLLIDHFRRKIGERLSRTPQPIETEALDLLTRYAWPGNVRELEHTLERLYILTDAETIGVQDLPSDISKAGRTEGTEDNGRFTLPEQGVDLEEVEINLIRQALQKGDGQLKKAAQLLGLSYKTLQYRVRKYGLK